MRRIISTLDDGIVNCYKVKANRGYKELLDEIKDKYSTISRKKYHSGYFDPSKIKIVITDYDLKDYDELDVTSCIMKSNSHIYINNQSHQIYSGKVNAYKYPTIYKILNQESIDKVLIDLNSYLYIEDEMSLDEKKMILTELFQYLDFDIFISADIDNFNKLKFEINDEEVEFIRIDNLKEFMEQPQKKYIKN